MYEHEVLIADIPSEGILGIDFLEQNICDIILKEKCLRINGGNVPCFRNMEPVSWVGRITLFEDLVYLHQVRLYYLLIYLIL